MPFATNGVTLTGSGTNRSLAYKPLDNAFGTNQVTIVGSDRNLSPASKHCAWSPGSLRLSSARNSNTGDSPFAVS